MSAIEKAKHHMTGDHFTSPVETRTGDAPSSPGTETAKPAPAPLNAIERRILGVLMEKARTTPDAYPLSLSGLVTGCNQKSNRHPVMNLTPEKVEDTIIAMRQKQLVAEVLGGGRVAKFRHYGYDYLGVKGVDAAVMTELLLRGEQTAGELRTRAARFEPIPDLAAMHQILDRLQARELVVALSPPGRGQMFSHNLYEPQELERLQNSIGEGSYDGMQNEASAPSHRSPQEKQDLESLRSQVLELQQEISELRARLEALEK